MKWWRRKWQPTPVLLAGESHGRGGLVGYSLWGCKESDANKQHTHTHTHTMKRTSFWVLVLEGLLGLHGTVQLQLLQYSW